MKLSAFTLHNKTLSHENNVIIPLSVSKVISKNISFNTRILILTDRLAINYDLGKTRNYLLKNCIVFVAQYNYSYRYF